VVDKMEIIFSMLTESVMKTFSKLIKLLILKFRSKTIMAVNFLNTAYITRPMPNFKT